MTTLSDITKLKEKFDLDPQLLLNDNTLTNYLHDLEVVGVSVFENVPNSDLITAMALLQTACVSYALGSENFTPKELGFISDVRFSQLLAIAFKISVALSVSEEMR
jgi:hypothetical protein